MTMDNVVKVFNLLGLSSQEDRERILAQGKLDTYETSTETQICYFISDNSGDIDDRGN